MKKTKQKKLESGYTIVIGQKDHIDKYIEERVGQIEKKVDEWCRAKDTEEAAHRRAVEAKQEKHNASVERHMIVVERFCEAIEKLLVRLTS